MITLYRHPDSARGAAIQEALEEIVIRHEVVTVASAADLPEGNALTIQDLPALIDDGVVYTGEAALDRHVEALRRLMEDWNRFQSDTCEIDDEGRVCGHESVRNEDGPGMSVNPALRT